MTDPELIQVEMHIPEGIAFECSGCGNCCFSWPVPLTASDVNRIERLTGDEAKGAFRPLHSGDERLSIYTHTLEKRADGRCTFLTEDNRCRLHNEFGAQSKPAMCQLFPYTFTPTPSGVYASVSFASSAVLFNTGRLLSQQEELLQQQWRLLKGLMPGYSPDWNSIQLMDGVPLGWNEYLGIENELLSFFHVTRNPQAVEKLCEEAAKLVAGKVLHPAQLEQGLTDARPKIVDQILLKTLLQFYFPSDVFADTSYDFDARAVAEQLVKPPNKVNIEHGGKVVTVGNLLERKFGMLDDQSESLLKRFIYCRIFSKLYFGPGFNGLSFVAGMHHILFLVALLRIQLKLQPNDEPSQRFLQLAELVRVLERRLTTARLSRESATILEVLLQSPSRIQRILEIAS